MAFYLPGPNAAAGRWRTDGMWETNTEGTRVRYHPPKDAPTGYSNTRYPLGTAVHEDLASILRKGYWVPMYPPCVQMPEGL